MKKPNKSPYNISRMIIFLMLVISVFILQSCDTEIPTTDTEPPTFSFLLKGTGINRTFTQDDDFDSFQINLTADASYNFVYAAGDSGGLKLAQMQFPDDYVQFETEIPDSWTTWTGGLSRYFTWLGDVSNPTTGTVLTGTFKVKGNNVSLNMILGQTDFGGESGRSNATLRGLNIYIGEHPTEIIPL